MTIWWCMAVVNHHRLFKNAFWAVSEFAHQSAPKHVNCADRKIRKKHLKNDSAMKSNRERLLRWLFGGVWQLSIITGCSKMLSEQFLNSPIRRIESADSADSIRRSANSRADWEMMFSEPKNESEQILWLGWLLESAFGTADHREIAELLSHRRNTWFEFGVFSEKKTFFFEKFVIFLKNLSMGKSRKWHQKMFLRWNQKRSGFSNPFRPPGIVGEVSADTRSSKISSRLFCMLNSPQFA